MFVVFFCTQLYFDIVPDSSILVFLNLHYHKTEGIAHRVHKYDPWCVSETCEPDSIKGQAQLYLCDSAVRNALPWLRGFAVPSRYKAKNSDRLTPLKPCIRRRKLGQIFVCIWETRISVLRLKWEWGCVLVYVYICWSIFQYTMCDFSTMMSKYFYKCN
jgi:hypothetical protein